MDRRTFFKGLAGLFALSFLPKIPKAPEIMYYGNSVHITDELIEDYRVMGISKPSIMIVPKELEETARRLINA